jgi:DNA-directed RNA polymerase specialized sigma24 family protein
VPRATVDPNLHPMKRRAIRSRHGLPVFLRNSSVAALFEEVCLYVATPELLREEPGLTQLAFTRLLDWLDGGDESGGRTYLEIRGRLVAYFERRNRPFADDLADETLGRIARTLEASGSIAVTPPARYCYVVARFVLLEDLRHERRHVPVHEGAGVGHERARVDSDAVDSQERRLACLDRCLYRLKPEQQELAIEYYRDVRRERIERRRRLAERLGISMNALGIRASRIRDALEACIRDCCGEAGDAAARTRPQEPASVPAGETERESTW